MLQQLTRFSKCSNAFFLIARAPGGDWYPNALQGLLLHQETNTDHRDSTWWTATSPTELNQFRLPSSLWKCNHPQLWAPWSFLDSSMYLSHGTICPSVPCSRWNGSLTHQAAIILQNMLFLFPSILYLSVIIRSCYEYIWILYIWVRSHSLSAGCMSNARCLFSKIAISHSRGSAPVTTESCQERR